MIGSAAFDREETRRCGIDRLGARSPLVDPDPLTAWREQRIGAPQNSLPRAEVNTMTKSNIAVAITTLRKNRTWRVAPMPSSSAWLVEYNQRRRLGSDSTSCGSAAASKRTGNAGSHFMVYPEGI